MMKIQVLGSGCAKCEKLLQLAEEAVQELGLGVEVTKVSEIREIMALGVMLTPALVVDGKVKVSGRLPSLAEVKAMLQ